MIVINEKANFKIKIEFKQNFPITHLYAWFRQTSDENYRINQSCSLCSKPLSPRKETSIEISSYKSFYHKENFTNCSNLRIYEIFLKSQKGRMCSPSLPFSSVQGLDQKSRLTNRLFIKEKRSTTFIPRVIFSEMIFRINGTLRSADGCLRQQLLLYQRKRKHKAMREVFIPVVSSTEIRCVFFSQ